VPLPIGPDPNTLAIATSPEMSPLLGKLAEQFNTQQKGKTGFVPVKVVVSSPQEMVTAALQPDPDFQAINPDSSIWLSKLGSEWGVKFKSEIAGDEALPIPRQRYALPQRFATSPVVIAMWQKTAESFGWPTKPVGWNALQERAAADKTFSWNHPSTAYASGLLATLAEFYAGAGVSRGLTAEMATADATLAYVKKVEGTVRFYGEGESAVLDRLKKDGTSLLDAFVAQEQIVLRWNTENPAQKLVAVYPVEGTLWADHPLALLERYADYDHSALTNEQRDTYYEFARYILTDTAQQQALAIGYRPVNTAINLMAAGSPFAAGGVVDALQPKTTLQIPPYSVVMVIEDVRAYIKRPTNVILVVDTSGSMGDAAKLPKAKTALTSFIANIKGSKDRLGLISFGSTIKYNSGLQTMTEATRTALTGRVDALTADGNTAIYDAVQNAYNQLQSLGDSEAINAIVVMTDGQENASRVKATTLEGTLTSGKVPVVVFSIAFGKDADTTVMQRLAKLTNGQFRQAESINIDELYKILATYF
jgi:Ca-activated chloride channel family protein